MNIILSNTSNEPIYLQIKNQIKDFILKGEIKEGDSLPSMRRLAQDLLISVITTKRAYEELEKEGFITTFVGKGSFVAGKNLDFIQEKRLKMIEDGLADLVEESKKLSVTKEQLIEMLEMLYEVNS